MRTLSCDPRAETLGVNILAFFHGLRSVEIAPIIEKHELDGIRQGDWIPTFHFIDALNELSESTEFTSALVGIGMEVGAILPIPGNNPGLSDALMTWNDIYQGLHRNADVGQIVCEKLDDQYYTLTLTDIYPDDFSYGMAYGYARRFLPPGMNFSVAYDLDIRPRDRGGETGKTVIHIKWE